MSTLQTFDAMHNRCNSAGHPCAYWGEHGEWLVGLGHSRDSDAIEDSNFRALLRKLGGESDTVAIERESHWAVGWVEFILINPADQERVTIAEKLKEGLEDYPIADESDFSELENEQCRETWENCYSPRERVKYLREHIREPKGFRELRAAVGGDWYEAGNLLPDPSALLY